MVTRVVGLYDLALRVGSGLAAASTGIAARCRNLIKGCGVKDKDIVRVIIEGGYQDDWSTQYVDRETYTIPQDVSRITLASGYTLDLLLRLDDGKPVMVQVSDAERKPLCLDYNWFLRIQRPTTIITDDGRVFHDMQLLRAGDGLNDQRLKRFLRTIAEQYGNGGFQRVYERRTFGNEK